MVIIHAVFLTMTFSSDSLIVALYTTEVTAILISFGLLCMSVPVAVILFLEWRKRKATNKEKKQPGKLHQQFSLVMHIQGSRILMQTCFFFVIRRRTDSSTSFRSGQLLFSSAGTRQQQQQSEFDGLAALTEHRPFRSMNVL